jgi:Fe-S-cluster-containing dehydrogenase component
MDPTRRNALKCLAVAGASACACGPTSAREAKTVPAEAVGMLYDTTRCIGCKTCVVACKQANELAADTHNPESVHLGAGLYDAPTDLNGVTKNVIKLHKDGDSISYMKAQCMHCVDPACAAACMLGSLHKDEVTGIVTYNPDYCVGCRYCMMACPFNVAKFEFDKALPNIVKCELCRHRVKDAATTTDGFTRYPRGQGPACCEVCPREAVIYGQRDELLAEAKRRIAAHPGRYFEDRVYGETDGGGTQVLYISHVPFEAVGLPNLGTQGVPHTAMAVQEGIYWKLPFVAPAALFAVLAGVTYRNRRAGKDAAQGEDER